MKIYLFIISLFFFSHSYSQLNKKSVNALRINESPTIDGVLDEIFWKNAEIDINYTPIFWENIWQK